MAANADAFRSVETQDASGLSDLRRASILELSLVMLLLAWLVGLAAISYVGDLRSLWVALPLAAGGMAVAWLRKHQFHAALILLILSSQAAIVAQEAFFPAGPSQFLFPVVVVASSLLVSGFRVFIVASLASLAILALARWHGVAWSVHAEVGCPIALNFLTAFAAWLGARPMRIALERTQSSYSRKLNTVSLALRAMSDPNSVTNWGAIFTMSSLSLVPVIIIFIIFQRYLVQGISTTGLKG